MMSSCFSEISLGDDARFCPSQGGLIPPQDWNPPFERTI